MEENCISPADREALIAQLGEVHLGFQKVIEVCGDADWSAQRNADEWSPAQVAEHTLLVEASLLQSVINHLDDVPSPERRAEVRGKTLLLRRFLPSTGKAQASVKNSTFAGMSKIEVLSGFAQSRRNICEHLNAHADTPFHDISWPHSGFGLLTAYQWLLYIPLHSERHLGQMRRIAEVGKSELGESVD